MVPKNGPMLLACVGGAAADVNAGAVSIASPKINISGLTTFASGYDPSTKETPAGAQSKVDTLAGTLGNMAWEDLVEAAKLGTTIIEGGYIKTSLLSIDYAIIVGTKPPADADKTSSNPQNVAWLTDAGAMAYEDLVEAAKLGTTVIVGGYLKTDLIQAGSIYGVKIGAMDLTSKTLTADTGTIGGWALSTVGIYKTGIMGLASDANLIWILNTAFGYKGVQLQYIANSGRFYAGDGANQYIKFDGTSVTIRGGLSADSINSGTMSFNYIAGGSAYVHHISISDSTCYNHPLAVDRVYNGQSAWFIGGISVGAASEFFGDVYFNNHLLRQVYGIDAPVGQKIVMYDNIDMLENNIDACDTIWAYHFNVRSKVFLGNAIEYLRKMKPKQGGRGAWQEVDHNSMGDLKREDDKGKAGYDLAGLVQVNSKAILEILEKIKGLEEVIGNE